ncbi:MarR family winged helix-turn-helix transcriptional regulator [Phaeacidiphilus oryzae]|uniref:MarR family winged helix-turn-helix transcriptional regulator n=1 Tax=Phaeacidiphilus oryzae TaxID=348818 RepID=UPI00055BAA4A|nr:MarR family winged helix-turn-helix transcriptional regulator [Phaeacidiphilus oryzae]
MPHNSEGLAGLAPAVQAASRALHRVAPTFPGVQHLPPGERDVLKLAIQEPGVGAGRVARELTMKPSNVSAAVRALEARGLLLRRSDPADGRAVQLFPTEQAEVNLRRVEEGWARVVREALAQLPEADARILAEAAPALDRLAAALAALRGRA